MTRQRWIFGHPPACTCVTCNIRRLARIREADREEWRPPEASSEVGRTGSQGLHIPGAVWAVIWMVAGAVLAVAFLPLFPTVMVAWVDQGQEWALELKAWLG